jgi:predicted ATPase
MEAHHALGVTLSDLGEFSAALEHLEQAIAVHKRHYYESGAFNFGQDAGVVCGAQAAWVLWLLGSPQKALKKSEESLSLARRFAHPYSLVVALNLAALLRQHLRDSRGARELAEEGISLSTEHDFPFWTAMGTILRGWTLTETNEVPNGITQMRQGLTVFQAMGADLMRPYYLTLLAESYGKLGQVNEALTLLTEAQDLMGKSHECWWEAEVYRRKGELMLSGIERPDPENEKRAETLLQKALHIASHQKAKSLELRATISLCRLWQNQGKGGDARRMINQVYGSFSEGFDQPDLREAKLLVSEPS